MRTACQKHNDLLQLGGGGVLTRDDGRPLMK